MEKQLTVKEFKMWLDGVREMQPDGWVPDARQWTRILEKIDDIQDVAPNTPRHTNYNQPNYPVDNRMVIQPEQPQPMQFSSAPSGLGGAAPVMMNTAAPIATGNEHIPVRTPNIDTSSGSYDPAFI